MSDLKYPEGWDEDRVNELIRHYETQSEEEAVAEDEATLVDPRYATVEVPLDLVPAVRELIAKHRKVG